MIMLMTATDPRDRTKIRPATSADCRAVEGIALAAYARYLPRMERAPGPMLEDYATRVADGSLHVLETDRGVTGFVVLVPQEEAMLLDNIAVDPAEQGRGLGRKLMEFVESAARAAGLAELRLYTNEVMVESLALYARLGFVETRRALEKGYQRVFMVKKL